ncbi:MAG: hypothetical protein ACRD2Q_10930, partial [Terriglobales bacterium]
QNLSKKDVERLVKNIAKEYRKESFRQAIQQLEKSDMVHVVGAGNLGKTTAAGNPADRLGSNVPEHKGQLDSEGKATAIDARQSVNTITFDFKQIDGQQLFSEREVTRHELGHALQIDTDPVSEYNATQGQRETEATKFDEDVAKEKDSMSKEQAEQKVRQILGLPEKEKEEKK